MRKDTVASFVCALLVCMLVGGYFGQVCSARTATEPTPDAYLLSANRVGNLSLTEATGLREIQAAFGPGNVRTERRSREGVEEITVLVYIEGAGGVPSLEGVLTGPDKTLYGGLNVLDRRFATDKGIRVGSTVGEVKKVYRIDEFVTGGGAVNAMSEDAKMSFILMDVDPNNVPEATVIRKIRVWTP